MSTTFSSEPIPLHRDEQGDIRVGSSRVLLDLVIHAFQDGATPEAIVQMYPTLKLVDVYGAITYYLRHKSDVDSHLSQREQRAKDVRSKIETQQGDLSDIRGRLLKRCEKAGTGEIGRAHV